MRTLALHRLLGLALLTLVPVTARAQQAASAAPLRGDVNGDGRVTAADAQAVRDHVAGRASQPGILLLPNGDANGDGRITGVDAAMIQAFAAGRDVSRFGVGQPIRGGAGGGEAKNGNMMMVYECTVDVEANTQSCGTPRPEMGAAADLILDKASVSFVTTAAVAMRADPANEDTTQADLAVKNNLVQPIGTTDGTTAAPNGVRVFFFDGPRVTTVKSGTLASATVRLEGSDGTADFAGPNGEFAHTGKPYIQYNGVVPTGGTSGARMWRFVYSSNTKHFTYSFAVSAPVQFEHGWITISPASLVLGPGEASPALTATVRSATGATLDDAVTWSSSDNAVATVDASGVVTGVAEGTATITATSSVKAQRKGSVPVRVDAAPTVTSTTPANGATQVAANGDIAITFSEAVDVTTSSFTLECPASTAKTFTISGSGTATITLNPDADLPAGTTCTVNVVGNQVSDSDTYDGPNLMAGNYSFSFEVNIQAVADVFGTTTTGNVRINSANTSPAFSVTANDQTNLATTTITFAGWNGVAGKTQQGGDVTMTTSGEGMGQFAYNPPAGFEGTDSLEYTITSGAASASAKVALPVSGMIWFVNSGATGCTTRAEGCGRLTNPYSTLAAFHAENNGTGNNPAANEAIFLYQGADYTGPVTLLNGQKLIGQDASATLAVLSGITPATGSDALPAMDPAGDAVTIKGADGVNLGTGNMLRGLTLAPTAGEAIGGTGFGTLTLATSSPDVTINAGGQALSLTTGTITGTFASVASAGGTNNVLLSGVTGDIDFGTGALSGSTGGAVKIVGGALTLDAGGNITQAAAAPLLDVSGTHTGALTFTGTLNATAGTGLQFSDADGTYSFTGTTTLAGGDAGIDITAGSGGTFTFASGTGVTNPTGTAFRVASSAPGITFNGSLTKNAASPGLLVDISGQSAGTITFANGTLSNTSTAGTGIQLSDVDGTVSFNGTTTLSGGDNGVDVIGGTQGTVTFSSASSISNPSGAALFVDASAPANLTFAGPISTNGVASRPVHIEDLTGGSVSVSGAVTSTGHGMLLQNNTSGTPTITFTGALTLTTGANAAVTLDNNDAATVSFGPAAMAINTTSGEGFRVVNGGTVNVTGTVNDVTSTTGVAVRISDTNVGGNGVRFRSVSANGAANGIFLNNTGTTGGSFRVDGTGAVGSGGSILNTSGGDGTTSGNGVYLNNVRNVVLTSMIINDHPNHGILGTTVHGFTLDNSRLAGTHGTNVGFDEAVISITGLSGVATFSNDSISGGIEDNVRILNHGVVGAAGDSILFNNVRLGHVNSASGNTNLLVRVADGSSNKVRVTNSTIHGARGGSLFHLNVVNSATANLSLAGNSFHNTQAAISGAGGVLITASGTSASVPTLTYRITNNTFRGARTVALNINKDVGQAVINGLIDNNDIGQAGVSNSGSVDASGIQLRHQGGGTHRAMVTNNEIYQYNNYGIILEAGDAVAGGGHGRMDMTLTNNVVSTPGTNPLAFSIQGIHANIGTVTDDQHILCLAATGNSIENSGTSQDVRLRQRMRTSILLPGYGGANSDNTAVNNFVKANNGNGVGLVVLASNSVGVAAPNGPGNGFANASCNAPTF